MKPKTCKICKSKFEPEKPLQVVCKKIECAIEYGRIHLKRTKIQSDKKKRLERKELKDGLMTKGDYENVLQTKINYIARLIDVNCPCVSSGKFGKMSGGHRFSVGSNNSIRFNLLNIWVQSYHDNCKKSGNPDGYDKFLIANGIYDLVHEVPTKYQFIKLSKDDLKEKIEIAKSIVKDLEKYNKLMFTDGAKRTIQQRVKLREVYNKKLGIY